MSVVFIPDLRASQELDVQITINTTAKRYLTTVRDLNEDGEYVVIHTPRTMADTTTTTVLPLSEIVAVTLHA